MSLRDAAGPVADGHWEWSLLLPPAWWHVPLGDGPTTRRAITRLLDRRLADQPRDAVVQLRRELDSQLRRMADQAAEAGGTDLWLQAEPVRGLPVSASLVVSALPGVGGDDPHRLVAGFGVDGVAELDVRELAGAPAVRRLRRTHNPPPTAAVPDTLAGAASDVTLLDWVAPVPDSDDAVLLTFATTTPQLEEALLVLFDAVAQSLTWRRR